MHKSKITPATLGYHKATIASGSGNKNVNMSRAIEEYVSFPFIVKLLKLPNIKYAIPQNNPRVVIALVISFLNHESRYRKDRTSKSIYNCAAICPLPWRWIADVSESLAQLSIAVFYMHLYCSTARTEYIVNPSRSRKHGSLLQPCCSSALSRF
jgi:hypothetical protein